METAHSTRLLTGAIGTEFPLAHKVNPAQFEGAPPVKGGNRIAKIPVAGSLKLRVALGNLPGEGLPCSLVGSKSRTTGFGGFG